MGFFFKDEEIRGDSPEQIALSRTPLSCALCDFDETLNILSMHDKDAYIDIHVLL